MNIKCCGQEAKLLLAWDDAQQTDHAYNLYACEKCGTIYKEDVWNDKGLRAIFLDGKMHEASPDEVWMESGLTTGVDETWKSIIIMNLKMAELKYMNGSKEGLDLMLMVSWALRKIYEQKDRDDLLKKFDMDELKRRGVEAYKSGEIQELSMSIGYLNAEIEIMAGMIDKYISDLLKEL